MAKRELTIGEFILANSVYGEKIDLSDKIISSGKYLPGQYEGTAMTPSGVMFMGSTYIKDYSSGDDASRGLFIHELAHVYQYQQSKTWLGFKFSTDYEFKDKIVKGIPFSSWTIEEKAAYAEEMYYRSIGQSRYGKGLTNEQLNAVKDNGLVVFDLDVKCFPATTPIQISLTATTPIADLRVGDVVLAFDPCDDNGRGALVPRRVTKLFRNVTDVWVRLEWVDPVTGEPCELVATPGHHFLDQFGNFPPIEQMIRDGRASVVLACGSVVEVAATRIAYSAVTADQFERASSVAISAGNTALAPHALDAWATYNFEVEDLHTTVAGAANDNISTLGMAA